MPTHNKIRLALWVLIIMGWAFVVSLLWECPPPVEGGQPRKPAISVRSFAPTEDVWTFGPFFMVGRPDFTGCPRWTLQEIKAENLDGPGDRSKSHWMFDFRALNERRIGDADYQNNPLSRLPEHPLGVARGHGVCAGDQEESQEATDATHHMSNCFPQDQAMNAQVWERGEQRGRDLVQLARKLKIEARVFEITVPLFLLQKPDHDKFHDEAWVGTFNAIGANCVWYPSHIAKSYYVRWGNRAWIETYVVKNDASTAHDDIFDHIASVDIVEFASNLNLWRGVEDEDDMEESTEKPMTLAQLEAAK